MEPEAENSRDAKIGAILAEIIRLQNSGNHAAVAALLAQYPDLVKSASVLLEDKISIDRDAERKSQRSADTAIAGPQETRIRRGQVQKTSRRSLGGESSHHSDPSMPSLPPEPATTFAFSLPDDVKLGSRSLGRYHIEQQLGEGAMGAVYLAHDSQLNRKVALKIPKFTNANIERLSKRFLREAQSAAMLHHRNICPVYDVGKIDGINYITMAYIEGKPLSAYVSQEKPLGQRQIAHIIRKLAIALQAAHDSGVVHRDLKPSNVIIDREGEPVVMDFGLASRIDNDGHSRLTKTGTILGTPAYMSPEQIEGVQQLIGPRSDIFSLGVIMYELLAGRLPFRGSPASVMGKVLVAKPPRLSELRPDVALELSALCESMMVKHPSKRMSSMREVAEKLTIWIRNSRQTEQLPQAKSSRASQLGVQSLAASGEEIAALPRQSGPIQDRPARDTANRIIISAVLPKIKAWLCVWPSQLRWFTAVTAILLLSLAVAAIGINNILKVQSTSRIMAFLLGKPAAEKSSNEQPTPLESMSDRTSPVVGANSITSNVGIRLNLIPSGEFMMGSPESEVGHSRGELLHRVRIVNPFYMAETEITQGQWQAVMSTAPWKGRAPEGSNYPASFISWDDATEFCRLLSVQDRRTYRLPTEAEWEYACRAGRQTKFSGGDTETSLMDTAWFAPNRGLNEDHASPVAQKRANPFGLYDMHGNVYEWCQDWYAEEYYANSPIDDPLGPITGSHRVNRGGCWGSVDLYCRSAARSKNSPFFRLSNLGFRIVCSKVNAVDATSKTDSEWVTLDSNLTAWQLGQADTEAWQPLNQLWSVNGNTLHAKRAGHHWIETIAQYQDFELQCEYRIPNSFVVGANCSGIVVRAVGRNSSGADPNGIEIDLRQSHDEEQGIGTGCFIAYETAIQNHLGINDGQSTGSQSRHLGRIQAPKLSANGWNELQIRCLGQRIEVEINGAVINEGWNVPERSGHICLRSQNTEVEFRNVRIKQLSP